MKIVKNAIEISELKEICQKGPFVSVIKAVIDVDKGVMAIDAELHSELMELLMKEEHSEPRNLWGINILPDKEGEEFMVFDSLINLKPGLGNRTRDVENAEIREKIKKIVNELVRK